MNAFGKFIRKSWVIGAAALMIAGSTTVMAFALGGGLPRNSTAEIPASVSADIDVSTTPEASVAQASPTQPAPQQTPAPVYTINDRTNDVVMNKDEVMKKLSLIPDMTPEKAEAEYQQIVANMTPGVGDMTAAQAAAVAAQIIAKVYGVDLTGYVAQTSFYRSNGLPDAGSWTVIFHSSNDADLVERCDDKAYFAGVDSVTGIIQNVSGYDHANTAGPVTTNLDDPSWLSTAQDYTKKLMKGGVSITGSRAVMKSQDGVSVVCSLSDGSAFGIRLMGDSKVVAAIIYYPNGYDGSLEKETRPDGGIG